jgi:hypothetical protein
MPEVLYVTREEIMTALDVKPSAYMRREVDRAARAGSRACEGRLHRIFYPEILTRQFDWPNSQGGPDSRLWFDERSLISLTSITSGGVTIPNASAQLRPDLSGPPYSHIDLDRNTSSAYSGGPQRAVSITGLWGYRNDERQIGTSLIIASTSATSITVSTPVDVGSVLRIDSERMRVTGKTWALAGQTTPTISADKASTSFSLADVSGFSFGETILIDAERMEIVDIAGNLLIVRRAAGGSVLAAHTAGTQVYVERALTVARGALGTTAATHAAAAPVFLWEVPSMVKELSQAYAEDIFLQRNSGYARTVGTGDSERQVSGRSIKGIEDRAFAIYGRGARMRAV